jgi:hypothetical protein
MKVMKDNNKAVNKLVLDLIPRIFNTKFEFVPENQYAIMTKETLIPENFKATLKVLLS